MREISCPFMHRFRRFSTFVNPMSPTLRSNAFARCKRPSRFFPLAVQVHDLKTPQCDVSTRLIGLPPERVSDVGLAAVCTLPNVRILDVSHLPLVSAKGLATLRWARLLWKVDLNGYEATAEFIAIVEQLKRCDMLSTSMCIAS